MSSQFSIRSTIPLPNTALTIPRLGFGVYRSHGAACITACLHALRVARYRHIDSAQFYGNEKEVGESVRQSGLKRSEVFVTTKIMAAGGSVQKSYDKCRASVEKIDQSDDGKGYVDLFLIHSPHSGAEKRKEMWLALEKLHQEGKAKSIGVSNYGVGQIEEMKAYATVWPPHVNQIELHPWCQQRTIVEYCNQNGIVIEAYSPLVRNQKANNKTLLAVAKNYDKTTSQILVRYCLQKKWVPLPKSENPGRIEENAAVFDFEISGEDMSLLDDLDQGDYGAIVQAVEN